MGFFCGFCYRLVTLRIDAPSNEKRNILNTNTKGGILRPLPDILRGKVSRIYFANTNNTQTPYGHHEHTEKQAFAVLTIKRAIWRLYGVIVLSLRYSIVTRKRRVTKVTSLHT